MADTITIEKGRQGNIKDLEETFPDALKDDFILIEDIGDRRLFYHYEVDVVNRLKLKLVHYDIVTITSQAGQPGRPIVIDVKN